MKRMLGRILLAVCIPFALAACGNQGAGLAAGFQQVVRAIIHRQDQIGADALADWIIQRRQDFVLLDVRPQEAFSAGHIQSAQSMPLSYLVERQTLGHLPRNRKLILYSNGNRKAAQAVVMLRLAGFDAYALLGGYEFWSQHLLHPEQPADAGDDEILRFRKQQAVACYFAGNYKGGAGQPESAAAAGFTPPVHAAPPPPFRAPKKGAPKIKEGC
jgi:rhodanese-related sulfurtransferase